MSLLGYMAAGTAQQVGTGIKESVQHDRQKALETLRHTQKLEQQTHQGEIRGRLDEERDTRQHGFRTIENEQQGDIRGRLDAAQIQQRADADERLLIEEHNLDTTRTPSVGYTQDGQITTDPAQMVYVMQEQMPGGKTVAVGGSGSGKGLGLGSDSGSGDWKDGKLTTIDPQGNAVDILYRINKGTGETLRSNDGVSWTRVVDEEEMAAVQRQIAEQIELQTKMQQFIEAEGGTAAPKGGVPGSAETASEGNAPKKQNPYPPGTEQARRWEISQSPFANMWGSFADFYTGDSPSYAGPGLLRK